MKTTFNKTLLAVALAGFGVSAQAATVAQTATDYSKQYIETVTASTVVDTDFTVTLGAEYKNDDIVTVKFTSPLEASYVAPNSVVGVAGVGGAVVTLGLLSQTADTLTYRVTDVNKTGGSSTIGNVLTFADVQFTAGVLNAAGKITAVYSAQTATGAIAIDTGKDNTKVVLAATNQFEAEVGTALSGLITLPGRVALDGNETDLLVTFDDDATLRSFVTLDSVTWTVEGDFSWVKDTVAGGAINPDATVVAAFGLPATCTLDSLTATAMVIECTDDADLTLALDTAVIDANALIEDQNSVAVDAGDATTLKKTDFTVTSSVNYSGTASGDFVALNDAAAGKWRVDGVEVDVPYLVKGTLGAKTFSHIVNARNNHTAAGNVTIDVYAQDGTVIASNVDAGSIAPNQVKELSGAINAVLGNSFNGKFSVTVFIEVPANSGSQVYSAYVDNSTSERAIVVNSSN